MASGVHVMEKPIQLQHHQQQQQQQKSHETLKCPRCDSLNTKFCYYNNYSLSQPRHFCKACKRYWTRGGTLRDVPVGGSCRKNKRVKRPITTTVAATSSPVGHQRNPNPNPNPNNNNNNNLDPNPIPSSNNPLFYALLSQNPNFPRLIDTASRVSCVTESSVVSRYDVLQASSGLVFSNPGIGGSVMNNHGQNNPSLTFSSFNSSMYGGGSTSSSTCAPTMASLLASSLDQQQRCMGLANYDGVSIVKDLKMEGIVQKMMDWNGNNFLERNKNHDQMEGVVSFDPNSILWDAEGGDWLDPTNNNIGSSVPSLI